MGRVYGNNAHYKDKAKPDQDFKNYAKLNDVKFEETYRMCIPNNDSEYYGTAKYDRPNPSLSEADKVELDVAFGWAVQHFRACQNSRVVPLEEAMSMATRSTSAGFPWLKKYKNKGEALDSIGVEALERHWDELTHPSCVPVVWRSTVKTERRPVEKLESDPPRLRVFTASPMQHSINLARLCLDTNERFYDSAGKTSWSFVGTSTFFRGFHNLFHRLNKHPNAYELDESAYDSSLFTTLMRGCFNWRWGCLQQSDRTDANFMRLFVLYRDIIDSYMLCGEGDVVVKHLGNPSGSANTIVDNTFCLFWIFAYAFVKLGRGRVRPNSKAEYGYSTFMELVEAGLNGDDNTFTVSDEIVSWFNAEAIALVWKDIGIITSSGTGDWAASKLKDLSFLSHGFGEYMGTIVPVPDYDKVMCSLLWGNPKSDIRFSLLRASALRIQSWMNPRCRDEINKYLSYIWSVRAHELVGTYENMSMEDINSVWKSDRDIAWLYVGCESVVDEPISPDFLAQVFELTDLT